jgi:hypothetical protein
VPAQDTNVRKGERSNAISTFRVNWEYASAKDLIAVWARSSSALTHTSGSQMFGEASTGDKRVVEPQGQYSHSAAEVSLAM